MDDSSGKSFSPRAVPRWVFSVVAILLVGAPLGVRAALQFSPGSDSPASGHSQVVSQGIIELNANQVVWRLVERTARPRWDAILARKMNGFIFASEEPVLLSNVNDAGLTNIARLAPGEALMVTDATRTLLASMTDTSTKYLVLELVPVAEADDVGSGDLLFKSQAFTPPPGERDVDLVRDVLAQGESSIIPDTGQEHVVLATEGAIDVIPGDGRATRLDAGESATFEGELEIQAAQPRTSIVQPVAALTAFLMQDQPTRASFVVAVVGDEIPPAAMASPSPIATLALTPTSIGIPAPPISSPVMPPINTPALEQPTATATESNVTPPAETPVAPPPTDTPVLPVPTDTPDLDQDDDGLLDEEERQHGTDPSNPDTDGDGLTDGEEVHIYRTNPLRADTDRDKLSDGAEVHVYGTNPNNRNTDGDRCSDRKEILHDPHNLFDPNVYDCHQTEID